MPDRTVKVSFSAITSNYISGLRDMKRATKEAASEGEKMRAKTAAQEKVLNAVGKAAVAFGTATLVGIGVAVKAYADWEAQMARVKAFSSAGAADMQRLSEATFEYARKFGLSATDAAAAEVELVKGGMSVKDMITGGLEGALALAAAGQMDVAEASSIVISTMNQFKLSGEDASHVADLLAAAANKAQGEVGDFGQALKYVGPVASNLGVSLEETTGTLALFAQNGIVAHQSGTSLRGMLQSLTSPSQQAKNVMDQLGIQLFDSQGKFVGLAGVADQLHDKLGGLTDAQRAQALGMIFGNYQITAANILFREGGDAVRYWTNQVDDSGAAGQQASAMLDNLQGDLQKLGAAWQNALIGGGEAAATLLRPLVQGITDVVEAFNKLPQGAKTAIVAALGVVGAISLIGGTALLMIPKIVAFDAALAAMGSNASILGGLKSVVGLMGALGPAALAVAAIGTAAFAAKKGLDALKASSAEIQNSLATATDASDVFRKSVQGEQWKVSQLFGGKGTWEQLQDLTPVLEAAANAGKGFWHSVAEGNFASARREIKEIGKELADLAGKNLPQAQHGFQTIAEKTDGTQKSLWRLLASMPDFRTKLTEVAREAGLTADKETLVGIAMGEIDLAGGQAADSSTKLTGALEEINDQSIDTTSALNELKSAIEGFGSVAMDADAAADAWEKTLDELDAALKENGKGLDNTTEKGRANREMLRGIADAAQADVGALAAAGGSVDELGGKMADHRQAFINAATAMGASAEEAEALADSYGLIPENVTTLVTDQGSVAETDAKVRGLFDKVKNAPKGKVEMDAAEVEGVVDQLVDLDIKVSKPKDGKVTLTLAGDKDVIKGIDKVADKDYNATVDVDEKGLAEVEKKLIETTAKKRQALIQTTEKGAVDSGRTIDLIAGKSRTAPIIANAQNIPETGKQLDRLTGQRTAEIIAIVDGAKATSALAALTVPREVQLNVVTNSGGGRQIAAQGGLWEHGVRKMATGGYFGPGIYRERPGGLINFAEPGTRWEAYVSGKPGMEARNVAILGIAANRFGLELVRMRRMAEGGYLDAGRDWRYAPAASLVAPTVNVAAPSLDGARLTGTLDLGDGLVGLMDARVQAGIGHYDDRRRQQRLRGRAGG